MFNNTLFPETPISFSKSDCPLCTDIQNIAASDNFQTVHLEQLSGMGSLRVLMDKYPIGHKGAHVLIVPEQHIPSLAWAKPPLDLEALVEGLVEDLLAMFPNAWVLGFEHGMGQLDDRMIQCGGCHIDHAHGHLLVIAEGCSFSAVREGLESYLSRLGWDFSLHLRETAGVFAGLRSGHWTAPYIHIGAASRMRPTGLVYTQPRGGPALPSQLLRRVVCEQLGYTDPRRWNWKIAVEHNLKSYLDAYQESANIFQEIARQYYAQQRLREQG